MASHDHKRFIRTIDELYPDLPDVRGAREDIRRSMRELIDPAEKGAQDCSVVSRNVM